eukprot:gene24880-1619_t
MQGVLFLVTQKQNMTVFLTDSPKSQPRGLCNRKERNQCPENCRGLFSKTSGLEEIIQGQRVSLPSNQEGMRTAATTVQQPNIDNGWRRGHRRQEELLIRMRTRTSLSSEQREQREFPFAGSSHSFDFSSEGVGAPTDADAPTSSDKR